MQKILLGDGRFANLNTGQRALRRRRASQRRVSSSRASQRSSDAQRQKTSTDIAIGDVEYKDGLTDIAFIALCRYSDGQKHLS